MKTILVPTDFSKGAGRAVKYAAAFARKTKAELILLHAYHVGYVSPDMPGGFIEQEITRVEKNSGDRLQKLSVKVAQAEKVRCGYALGYGPASEVILEMAKKLKPGFIIMGTQGAGWVKGALIGTNTAQVADRAKCPVIAVPEKVSVKPVRKIAFATNYSTDDASLLKPVTELAGLLGARVDVIHVADEEYVPSSEKEFMQKFMAKANKKAKYRRIAYRILYAKGISKTLQDYIKREAPAMLVVSARPRGVMDRIFGTSVTRKMAYHSTVPLLVLHQKG